jgi:hypothetical protein
MEQPRSPVPLRNLPKHARYEDAYRRFGWFWGLGVEHETYIATSQTRTVRTFDTNTMKPERYSVSYYKNYQPEPLKTALVEVLDASGGAITVPILMNCHSFTDCDLFGEHATTYEREPKPNPRYAGKTLFDWMCEHSAWLREEYGRVFMWDGDTLEFMTQRFYCATVADVMRELEEGERRFVEEIQKLPRQGVLVGYGPLRIAAPQNPPWATHLTNPRAVSMFNNGTLHINVTLPTRLGWDRRPLWPADFREKHRRLARLIQWMEPLWIAVYGSGDPFATRATSSSGRFASGSQRVAVSRYIGLGTYNTDDMPEGKILQVMRTDVGALPWYEWLHAQTAYAPLDVIGLDLNYNKHFAHGLELRFFDQMPMESLREVMTHLVVLMDMAMDVRIIVPDPRRDAQWQKMAGEALYEGRGWRVEPERLIAICRALGAVADCKEPVTPMAALTLIMRGLERYRGYCWQSMVTGRRLPTSPCGCVSS